MFNLFNKTKKKFKASCDLSGSMLDRESAYLLSTAQVISSKKFWDSKMTEPDTMTYTEAHFKSGDQTATNIRNMIFKKYSAVDKAWVISDAHLHLFDIDESSAKELANQWWDSEGKETPGEMSNSLTHLGDNEFENFKNYAVNEAGRRMVQI
ncbi:MAG: hypothetical protein CMB80_15095 [Flammeovirgaceae bacterium]|nr:hypothetical protein [Flammeovirgaceae bacterium]MBR08423.1 hypothetical protein [Rickettsiales bacterium]HCX24504.1 hypothetical protein [Cytophagales bacterium]|tara:strand:- start:119 stop:574 length:456 start_codon:yes stop_codon:yes gene_type:complete